MTLIRLFSLGLMPISWPAFGILITFKRGVVSLSLTLQTIWSSWWSLNSWGRLTYYFLYPMSKFFHASQALPMYCMCMCMDLVVSKQFLSFLFPHIYLFFPFSWNLEMPVHSYYHMCSSLIPALDRQTEMEKCRKDWQKSLYSALPKGAVVLSYYYLPT